MAAGWTEFSFIGQSAFGVEVSVFGQPGFYQTVPKVVLFGSTTNSRVAKNLNEVSWACKAVTKIRLDEVQLVYGSLCWRSPLNVPYFANPGDTIRFAPGSLSITLFDYEHNDDSEEWF